MNNSKQILMCLALVVWMGTVLTAYFAFVFLPDNGTNNTIAVFATILACFVSVGTTVLAITWSNTK